MSGEQPARPGPVAFQVSSAGSASVGPLSAVRTSDETGAETSSHGRVSAKRCCHGFLDADVPLSGERLLDEENMIHRKQVIREQYGGNALICSLARSSSE